MEWKIAWRDENSPYSAKESVTRAKVLLLRQVKNLLRQDARDISISRVPVQTDLGGLPFADIVTGFKSHSVVPFVGAGVPLCGRAPNDVWQYYPRFSDFLPSASELAAYIAQLANLPAWRLNDTQNLARVASYYTITNPNSPLANNLHAIFEKGEPTVVHTLLAEPTLHPMVIVTTNYDTLMEGALAKAGVVFDTIIHCTNIEQQGRVLLRKAGMQADYVDPMDADVNPATRTVLYKMHGSIDAQSPATLSRTAPRDNFVITEEDYVKFLSRLSAAAPVIPLKILDHFRKTSFLFLGYSLEDWNVRVILDSLNNVMHEPGFQPDRGGLKFAAQQSETAPSDQLNVLAQALNIPLPGARSDSQTPSNPRTHWAIQLHPTFYDIEVWRGRRVVIRNLNMNKFVSGLRDPIHNLFPKTT